MTSTTSERPDRWRALDAFRFVAVCLMVQGHTFTALLDDRIQQARSFDWHHYVHGFTAPMFLFGAGLAFGITTFRDFATHAVWGPAVRRRVIRYASIVALGYVMHVPAVHLRDLPSSPPAVIASALQVDALQLIGTAMLLLVGLVLVLRSARAVAASAAFLAVALVLVGPLVWRAGANASWPLWLAAYLAPHTGSLFPWIPWAAYVFGGAAVAYGVHMSWRAPARDAILLVAGLGGWMVGVALRTVRFDPFGPHDRWLNDPWNFVLRTGVMLALLGAYGLWAHRRSFSHGTLSRWVRAASQESLVVYVVHLLFLFGTPFFPGFEDVFHRRLGFGGVMLVFALVFAMSVAVAYLWQWVRKQHPEAFQRVRWVITVVLVLAVASQW